MPDQLERYLAAFAGQLLAAVAVVLDKALGAETGDHLADAWGRDAESLSEVTGRHRLVVAVQLVEGVEVILLGSGEAAAADGRVGHPREGPLVSCTCLPITNSR